MTSAEPLSAPRGSSPRPLRTGPGLPTATAMLCAAYLLSAADYATAQTRPSLDEPTRFHAGIGFLGAAAVGDFGTDVGGALGILMDVDVRLGKSLFTLGGEFGAMGYGSETRSVYVGNLIPDIPDLSIRVNTDNEMWIGHLRFGAQRRVGRWRPYANGLIGFTELATRTSINGMVMCRGSQQTGGVTCDSETAAEATNAKDVVLSYGVAAGALIGFRSRSRSPWLDVSLRYHRGGEAEYLTKGAIVREGDRAILNVSRSRTDMIMLYVGLAIGR
jgi:hypothetical protein